LGPILFVHCFAMPVFDRPIVVDENFGCVSKQKS
jgi:hypothetical protein